MGDGEVPDREAVDPEALPQLPTTPPPELTEWEFQRYYGTWAPMHPSAVLRTFDRAPFTWWVVGGWSLEADPRRPRRRHEDTDVAVRADQADAVRAWLRDFHLWQTYPGMRPVFPDDPLPTNLEQIWVRRDAWSPWVLDLLLNPTDGTDWLFKFDHRVRLPLADLVRPGPDGVPYQVPHVGLLFKAKKARDKDAGDLDACWPSLDGTGRQWFRDALAVTDPGHPWLARVDELGPA